MKFKPTKFAISLLIALLLTTSLNNAFGITACEHGLSSEIHHDNHPSDEHKNDLPEGSNASHFQHLTKCGDTCHDYLIYSEDTFTARKVTVKPPVDATILSITDALPNRANFLLSVHPPYKNSAQITSQAITALRTVVLLN